MTDSALSSPFAIDHELLDGNLEAKRQEGLYCPHCSQTMEWDLGPKTKEGILSTISRRSLHETFIKCDKDECPSVQEGEGTPILRRISAAADGSITVSTLRLEDILNELRILRSENSGLEKRATERVRIADSRAREEIETLRAESQRQLDEALAGKEDQLQVALEKIERLEGLLGEIDRIAEVKNPEDRLAVIRDLTRSARQMEEVCRLTGTTPVKVLENARAWLAKQTRR